MGKLIIISAPSGAGKSTIIRHLLEHDLNLHFSVSATSRKPRGEEKHGVEYFFLTPEDFKSRIRNNAFLEYEEVYENKFYGTLKSEVDRIMENGGNVILDVDCVGGLNIKNIYGEKAISIFVMPPSIETLKERLEKRGTDASQVIADRLKKAEFEISFAPKFDLVVLNDDFEKAKKEVIERIKQFVNC